MASTELSRVVDEDEDEPPPQAAQAARNGWDWDKICAYQTNKIVRIQDANLGILYWGIVTIVVLYIQIVVFHIEGRHMAQEQGAGVVVTKFHGKGFGPDGKAYDDADLRFPVVDPSGAFVMTRRVTMKAQKLGTCVDWDSPTKCPCGKYGTCVAGNYCEVKGWCPSLGDTNVDNPPKGAVVEVIEGIEDAVLSIEAGIGFPTLSKDFFVAGYTEGAEKSFKKMTVKQLLSKADPPIKFKDVATKGALIAVNFYWNCDLSFAGNCEPDMSVKRLDSGEGLVQKRASTRVQGGVQVRDAVYMYGLRILVDSSGVGRSISLVPIVIQLGSCIALMKIASMVADFLMLRMYDKERSNAYYRCKVQETQDYSDLQERLNLVQEQKQQARSRLAAGIFSKAGSGASVSLGLGAGGRGGMASAVLRGRSGAASAAASSSG